MIQAASSLGQDIQWSVDWTGRTQPVNRSTLRMSQLKPGISSFPQRRPRHAQHPADPELITRGYRLSLYQNSSHRGLLLTMRYPKRRPGAVRWAEVGFSVMSLAGLDYVQRLCLATVFSSLARRYNAPCMVKPGVMLADSPLEHELYDVIASLGGSLCRPERRLGLAGQSGAGAGWPGCGRRLLSRAPQLSQLPGGLCEVDSSSLPANAGCFAGARLIPMALMVSVDWR